LIKSKRKTHFEIIWLYFNTVILINSLQSLSYGGTLRYTTEYDSEILFYPELYVESVVVIRGGEGIQKSIQFKIEERVADIEKIYTIPMREVC